MTFISGTISNLRFKASETFEIQQKLENKNMPENLGVFFSKRIYDECENNNIKFKLFYFLGIVKLILLMTSFFGFISLFINLFSMFFFSADVNEKSTQVFINKIKSLFLHTAFYLLFLITGMACYYWQIFLKRICLNFIFHKYDFLFIKNLENIDHSQGRQIGYSFICDCFKIFYENILDYKENNFIYLFCTIGWIPFLYFIQAVDVIGFYVNIKYLNYIESKDLIQYRPFSFFIGEEKGFLTYFRYHMGIRCENSFFYVFLENILLKLLICNFLIYLLKHRVNEVQFLEKILLNKSFNKNIENIEKNDQNYLVPMNLIFNLFDVTITIFILVYGVLINHMKYYTNNCIENDISDNKNAQTLLNKIQQFKEKTKNIKDFNDTVNKTYSFLIDSLENPEIDLYTCLENLISFFKYYFIKYGVIEENNKEEQNKNQLLKKIFENNKNFVKQLKSNQLPLKIENFVLGYLIAFSDINKENLSNEISYQLQNVKLISQKIKKIVSDVRKNLNNVIYNSENIIKELLINGIEYEDFVFLREATKGSSLTHKTEVYLNSQLDFIKWSLKNNKISFFDAKTKVANLVQEIDSLVVQKKNKQSKSLPTEELLTVFSLDPTTKASVIAQLFFPFKQDQDSNFNKQEYEIFNQSYLKKKLVLINLLLNSKYSSFLENLNSSFGDEFCFCFTHSNCFEKNSIQCSLAIDEECYSEEFYKSKLFSILRPSGTDFMQRFNVDEYNIDNCLNKKEMLDKINKWKITLQKIHEIGEPVISHIKEKFPLLKIFLQDTFEFGNKKIEIYSNFEDLFSNCAEGSIANFATIYNYVSYKIYIVASIVFVILFKLFSVKHFLYNLQESWLKNSQNVILEQYTKKILIFQRNNDINNEGNLAGFILNIPLVNYEWSQFFVEKLKGKPKITSNTKFCTVLSNIKNTILPGTKIGFIGSSGSGKSTILNLLNSSKTSINDHIYGILVDENTNVYLKDLAKISKEFIKNSIAFVPQFVTFPTEYTVMDVYNLFFSKDLQYMPVFIELLRKLEMGNFVDRDSQEFSIDCLKNVRWLSISGGQKRRFIISLVLTTLVVGRFPHDKDLNHTIQMLVIDELLGLGRTNRQAVYRLLKEEIYQMIAKYRSEYMVITSKEYKSSGYITTNYGKFSEKNLIHFLPLIKMYIRKPVTSILTSHTPRELNGEIIDELWKFEGGALLQKYFNENKNQEIEKYFLKKLGIEVSSERKNINFETDFQEEFF